jgi:hypothetical protein
MNTYGAGWKDKQVVVEAETTYQAQQLALPLFQAMAGRQKVKSHDIWVMLMKLNGVDYVHQPID